MIPEPIPPFDPSVLVMSLSWALISAVMFAHSIRMGARTAPWLWSLSFMGVCAIAVVFWRLV